MTSVSYQTHPANPLVRATFEATVNSTNATSPSPLLKTLFTEFVRLTPFLSDSGWAGYPELLFLSPESQTFTFTLLNPRSEAEANATISPYFEYARSLAANSSSLGGDQLTVNDASTFAPQLFRDFERQFIRPGTSETGVTLEITSRLLPRKLIEEDYVKVADTLLNQGPGVFYMWVSLHVSLISACPYLLSIQHGRRWRCCSSGPGFCGYQSSMAESTCTCYKWPNLG